MNNRNLHTFVVDMETTPRLTALARDWCIEHSTELPIIAGLSGVSSPSDVTNFATGVSQCFLHNYFIFNK